VARSPRKILDQLQSSAGEITGPNAKGVRIRVEGFVIDGNGSPVKDVSLECWQANAVGHHAHHEGGAVEDGIRGWGRVITDFETGELGFDTVKLGTTLERTVGRSCQRKLA
jgi:protocatechuate 3,4-dioxygenase alpha subunit